MIVSNCDHKKASIDDGLGLHGWLQTAQQASHQQRGKHCAGQQEERRPEGVDYF